MLTKVQLQYNGQQLQQNDVNAMGNSAALSGDVALQELLRLGEVQSGNVVKGIGPYGTTRPAGAGQVVPALGGVCVFPFTAYIGSRTAPSAGNAAASLAAFTDIRTAVYADSSTQAPEAGYVALTNGSGNIAIALIYAIVTVEQPNPVTRKLKDPTSKLITSVSTSPQLTMTVTIASTQSTGSSPPKLPGQVSSGSGGLPADGSTVFCIPLAYVRLPAGFSSASTPANRDIAEVYPRIGPGLGVAQCNSLAVVTPGDPSAALAAMTNTASPYFWTPVSSYTAQPPVMVPQTVGGGGSLVCFFDLTTGSTNQPTASVVDATRDYRNRFFRITASMADPTSKAFPWAIPFSNTSTATLPYRGAPGMTNLGTNYGVWNTHSLCDTGSGDAVIMQATSSEISIIGGAGSRTVALYVDHTTGALRLSYANSPNVLAFIWIEFTGQFSNR